jgi:LAS superfamily LD-carboxypeptidase LdcB
MSAILPGLVVHRSCPMPDSKIMIPIGKSRDGALTHMARPETVAAFQRMADSAGQKGIKLHVIWAFRDPQLQKEQFEEAKRKYGPRNGIRWLAPPGFSEHQTGWVLDIGDWSDPDADDNPRFERTGAFSWLQAHAGSFGFELSFPPGNWQGVSYEPWHWRFVGTSEAQRAFHPTGLSAVKVWSKSFFEAFRWWMHP